MPTCLAIIYKSEFGLKYYLLLAMGKLQQYGEALKQLKSAILTSRYKAAALANREMLTLYFFVGQLISQKTKQEKWGTGVLENLSKDLQAELPGLRGFSASNLKKMRIFFEAWSDYFVIGSSATNELKNSSIGSLPTNQLVLTEVGLKHMELNGLLGNFHKLGFTHHYEIIFKSVSLEERLFYINAAVAAFWSVDTLKHHLKARLFTQKGALSNNFKQTLPAEISQHAILTFKDEYLLDYINIEEPGEEDERLIENGIIANMKKFLMSLGPDFAFVGNQHRMIVEDQEFFVDLLFFNRQLQCLVAIDLKKGLFKPEYLGKMNFYLSALDDLVRLPHEKPSIGIILCKEKKNKIVEFAFRDFNKAMGVATFKTSTELPEQFRGSLPDAQTLKKLMD